MDRTSARILKQGPSQCKHPPFYSARAQRCKYGRTELDSVQHICHLLLHSITGCHGQQLMSQIDNNFRIYNGVQAIGYIEHIQPLFGWEAGRSPIDKNSAMVKGQVAAHRPPRVQCPASTHRHSWRRLQNPSAVSPISMLKRGTKDASLEF